MKPIVYAYLLLVCFTASIFCGNYTYYGGFAYNTNTGTVTNQTMSTCVCQCLLTSGCSGFTFFNSSRTCALLADLNITEDEVNLNTDATLLLVSANLVYS
ncbi:unnamed protein product [Adineta steineri]|uniref:Apple domain-containing protein n=1 Tax=Adineta steineri TaxID=433720 RepID=A0A813Z8B0_9BILA|nr:unnamed protein product [Adineta steineri]CAF0915248.1 unnamed protein product [Adineta steineri]